MCNKANLPNRVEKANAAMFFSSTTQYTKDGKPKVFIIPGSQAKQYQVILRRIANNNGGISMTVEVNLLTGFGIKLLVTSTVSYHGMCAVQMAAQESGYKVMWCANEIDAARLANINGKKFSVSQFKNPTSKMWGVMKKEQ